ncbi:hypothetical protein [Haloarcula sp. 1CSR25-25]|uniref:hypothetical protein n=1 Tax=Haloarcula sp. 1CSR25-25 TaxID=2862545 RepID=UPI0028A2B889|nr:hypothetical protein [Haloarcula sp. 1CSR25-25]
MPGTTASAMTAMATAGSSSGPSRSQEFAGVTDRLQEWMGDDSAAFEQAAVEPE